MTTRRPALAPPPDDAAGARRHLRAAGARRRRRGAGRHDDAAAQEAAAPPRCPTRPRPLGRGLGGSSDHAGRASANYARGAGRARATGHAIRGRRAGRPPPRTPAPPGAAAAAAGPGLVFTAGQILALMPGGTGNTRCRSATGCHLCALLLRGCSNPPAGRARDPRRATGPPGRLCSTDPAERWRRAALFLLSNAARASKVHARLVVPNSGSRDTARGLRQRHDPPKLVGGEGRQATATLGAPAAMPARSPTTRAGRTSGDARRAAAGPVAGDVAKKGLSAPAGSVAGRRACNSGRTVAAAASVSRVRRGDELGALR